MPPQNPLPILPIVLLPLLLLLATYPSLTTAAHDHTNGLDPTTDTPISLAHGHMLSFLHFTPGDTLWLDGWVPGRGTTLLGACVGLFLLGVGERWVAALRGGVERAVGREGGGGRMKLRRKAGEKKKCKSDRTSDHPPLRNTILMRPGTLAPFVADHAWARFILHGAQASIAILFMLAVMTFQVSFILSIVIGLGVGEAMYGRFVDAMRVRDEQEGQ